MLESMTEWMSLLMYCAFERKWGRFYGMVLERPKLATNDRCVVDTSAEQIVGALCCVGNANPLGYLL